MIGCRRRGPALPALHAIVLCSVSAETYRRVQTSSRAASKPSAPANYCVHGEATETTASQISSVSRPSGWDGLGSMGFSHLRPEGLGDWKRQRLQTMGLRTPPRCGAREFSDSRASVDRLGLGGADVIADPVVGDIILRGATNTSHRQSFPRHQDAEKAGKRSCGSDNMSLPLLHRVGS
jgi:hypothetical protein